MGYITWKYGNFDYNFLLYFIFASISVILTAIYIPVKTKSEKEISSSEIKFKDFLSLFFK